MVKRVLAGLCIQITAVMMLDDGMPDWKLIDVTGEECMNLADDRDKREMNAKFWIADDECKSTGRRKRSDAEQEQERDQARKHQDWALHFPFGCWIWKKASWCLLPPGWPFVRCPWWIDLLATVRSVPSDDDGFQMSGINGSCCPSKLLHGHALMPRTLAESDLERPEGSSAKPMESVHSLSICPTGFGVAVTHTMDVSTLASKVR